MPRTIPESWRIQAQVMADTGINPKTGRRLPDAERRAYARAGGL